MYSRRDFLKSIPASTAGSVLQYVPGVSAFAESSNAKSTVSVVQLAESTKLTARNAKAMIEKTLLVLTGKSSVNAAWKELLAKKRRIGVKINALGGRLIVTSPLLVEGLALSLTDLGTRPDNIIVWDRSKTEMERAGYSFRNRNRYYRCLATDMVGYSEELFEFDSVGSLISRILLDECDILIDFTVLKDHSITGVSGAIKNLMGVIHNPNRYHLNHGNPYVADLLGLRPLRKKLVLSICDCFHFQYNRGPAYNARWFLDRHFIMASLDTVALDAVGWQMIDQMRQGHGLPTLEGAGRRPSYILTASNKGFGNSDASRIELIKDFV